VSLRRRRAVLWCALLLLAGLYIQRNVVIAARHLGPSPSDFRNYWAAAAAWAGGGSPYTVHNFDYPPLAAAIVMPFALLDYPTARAAWFIVGHLALLAAAIIVWRSLGADLESAVVVAAVWTLAGSVAVNLVSGQVNPLLLVLAAASAAGFASARDTGAGAALGLAAGLKIWPAALLWPAVVARRGRALAAGFLVTTLSIGAPALLLVAAGTPPYVPASSGYWAGTPAFLNLSLPATALRLRDLPHLGQGMPRTWLLGNNPEQFRLEGAGAALSIAIAAAAIILGFAWIRRAATAATPWLATLGATIAVTLAAAPVSWHHYRLLHLPALAWLLATCVRASRWRSALLAVTLVIVLSSAHALHGPEAWRLPLEPWSVLIRGAVVPAAELALAWWLLHFGRREPAA
jgi:hypothetical protein